MRSLQFQQRILPPRALYAVGAMDALPGIKNVEIISNDKQYSPYSIIV